MLYSTHLKHKQQASGDLTSSFTTDKFKHGIVTIRSEKAAGYNKKMQNRTKVTGNSTELDYPNSRWEILAILLSQKRFLSIKIKHRQSQTMFGRTTPVL
jgi:hypothetical protein